MTRLKKLLELQHRERESTQVFESRCESLLVVDRSVISGAAEGRPAN